MPAIMDDPATKTIYRVSGEPPFPDPNNPALPATIQPRQVTLRDRQTVATVVPFASRHQVPEGLLRYLNDQFNKEIEGGDTYPMLEGMDFEKFASYWFQNFGAIMLLGRIDRAEDVVEDGTRDWSRECLGTFYIKPNYPGRSSHVCNAGFIVTDASRNRGVGRLMGEAYLDWAPKLGYIYSVFNLVYETNVASCRIWDGLGFKRIGRVKGCGNLKSYPGRLIDAIIYGRDLVPEPGSDGASAAEEPVSEERFDKIKFYLKTGKYPAGADRAEKSRLRSAATHYKLLRAEDAAASVQGQAGGIGGAGNGRVIGDEDGLVLMLKDKEVIADPGKQFEIARTVHVQTSPHAGINKTTAIIAERYHWSRIKETVSDVIRTCEQCKDLGKNTPAPPGANNASSSSSQRRNNLSATASGATSSKRASPSPSSTSGVDVHSTPPRSSLPDHSGSLTFGVPPGHYEELSVLSPPQNLDTGHAGPHLTDDDELSGHNPMLQDSSASLSLAVSHAHSVSVYQPIDPQIITQPSSHAHHHPLHHHHHYSFHHHTSHHHHHDPDTETFQALLDAADIDASPHPHHHDEQQHPDDTDQAAVDRDLEMLIEPQEDDEDDASGHPGHMDIDHSLRVVADPPPDPTRRTGGSKMDVSHLITADDDDDDGREEKGRDSYEMEFDRHS